MYFMLYPILRAFSEKRNDTNGRKTKKLTNFSCAQQFNLNTGRLAIRVIFTKHANLLAPLKICMYTCTASSVIVVKSPCVAQIVKCLVYFVNAFILKVA